MKLKLWYEFNFHNQAFVCNIGLICVKVFRDKSLKREDMIFEQLMYGDDMAYLFGDYELIMFKTEMTDGHSHLCVCIHK